MDVVVGVYVHVRRALPLTPPHPPPGVPLAQVVVLRYWAGLAWFATPWTFNKTVGGELLGWAFKV